MQTIQQEVRSHVKAGGQADETRTFEKGKVELYRLGQSTLGRATFEPGWKWSECVKPIAKTEYCECAHTGYQLSGTMRVVPKDGAPYVINAGDSFYIPPGHDGWVVGQEPVVVLDFQGMADYATQPKTGPERQRKH